MEPCRSVAPRGEHLYMIDRFPPDAAREAASTLTELHDLWKAEVLVGSETTDSALDVAAYALYRAGALDDLLRRVSRTYRPDLTVQAPPVKVVGTRSPTNGVNGHPFARGPWRAAIIEEQRRGDVSPKAKMVRLRTEPAIAEMLKRWTLSEEPNIGWCLVCDRPIRDLNDLIPGTNFHRCRAHASEAVPAPELPRDRIH